MHKYRYGLAFEVLILFTLSAPVLAGDIKSWFVPLSALSDAPIYAASQIGKAGEIGKIGQERLTITPLDGRGWARYQSAGEVRLALDNGNSTPANAPARTFAYPWVRHAQQGGLTLKVLNTSPGANRVTITRRSHSGTGSQEIEIAALEDLEISVPEDLVAITIEGSDLLVSYLLWKESGRTVWIDPGESTPPEVGTEEQYALVLEGTAAAVQVQLQGEEVSIDRPAGLGDSVSMTWHANGDTLKGAWVAADLNPFQGSVLGIVRSAAGTEPGIVDWVASDSEGNQSEVNLTLQRIQ